MISFFDSVILLPVHPRSQVSSHVASVLVVCALTVLRLYTWRPAPWSMLVIFHHPRLAVSFLHLSMPGGADDRPSRKFWILDSHDAQPTIEKWTVISCLP